MTIIINDNYRALYNVNTNVAIMYLPIRLWWYSSIEDPPGTLIMHQWQLAYMYLIHWHNYNYYLTYLLKQSSYLMPAALQ